jgi:hypothetical protein
MKCEYCGKEIGENKESCSFCGRTQKREANFMASKDLNDVFNPVGARVNKVLHDGWFVIICISNMINIIFAIFASDIMHVVLHFILSIFLWRIFINSCRMGISPANVHYFSGTVFAYYIINFVSAGHFVFAALIGTLIFDFAIKNEAIIDKVLNESNMNRAEFNELMEFYSSNKSWLLILCALLLLSVAAVIVLYNLFVVRKIHKFLKSVYRGMANGTDEYIGATAAQVCLIIHGSLSGLLAFISIFGFLESFASFVYFGINSFMAISGSVLIKKYFKTKTQEDGSAS